MSSNVMPYIQIVSENGGPVTLQNPWQGQTLVVYRNGPTATTASGSSVTLPTCPNDSLFVAPEGTSYASIVALVNAQ
jgi:hypothetical protein